MPKFEAFDVPNGDGWQLRVSRCTDRVALDKRRRPLLIVPGYGMNSHIFGYHPRGPSLMGYLAARGFEVWTADLRAQGEARSAGGSRHYQFDDIACTDLPAVIDEIRRQTASTADRVDLIGCNLGGSYVCIYMALVPGASDVVGSIVAIGTPLRWSALHPVLKLVTRAPWLIGKIPTTGTRRIAPHVLPILAKFPKLIGVYLHPDHVDLSRPAELTRTVEDPSPRVNRQLAAWMRDGDLQIRGVNISEAMRRVDRPLLVVLANADGIVPEATAMSARELFGSRRRDVLRVGTEALRFAHADLFISDHAQELVFEPMARWLIARDQEVEQA